MTLPGVHTNHLAKPKAVPGCEYHWVPGWGWGLFPKRPSGLTEAQAKAWVRTGPRGETTNHETESQP